MFSFNYFLIYVAMLMLPIRTAAQQPLSPKGYRVLIEKSGDLDTDGIPEKAIVYDTGDSADYGTLRELRLFKFTNKKWELWKSTRNAIRQSEEGGMMGDPFEGLEIKNGTLIIFQSGGSSWKWNISDTYRFQNSEFQLIGHTSYFGKPCEYWISFDFNLSTGKLIYKKDYESCENEDQKIIKTETETIYKRVDLNLNNRNLKEIEIITPRYKETLYL